MIFKIFNKPAGPIRACCPEPAPGGPLQDGGEVWGDPAAAPGLFTHRCRIIPTRTRARRRQRLRAAGGGGAGGPERLSHRLAPLSAHSQGRLPGRNCTCGFALVQSHVGPGRPGGAAGRPSARRPSRVGLTPDARADLALPGRVLLTPSCQGDKRLERTGGTDASSPRESGALPLSRVGGGRGAGFQNH